MPTSRQNPRPRAILGQCIAGWAASEPGYQRSLGVLAHLSQGCQARSLCLQGPGNTCKGMLLSHRTVAPFLLPCPPLGGPTRGMWIPVVSWSCWTQAQIWQF